MTVEERIHDQIRIEYSTTHSVACLIMERGDTAANSFTASKVEAMSEALEEINDVADCLILFGEQEFSVGADLRSIHETPESMKPTQIDNIAAASHRFIRKLRDFPAPVLAAIKGVAAGGGLGFALSCDLITMHENATLDPAYARIGLTPDNATPYFLTKILGPYKAREIFFNPEPITASEAIDFGIATQSYDGPESEFLDAAFEQATDLAKGPTDVYAETKKLVDTALEVRLDDHLDQEQDTIKRMSDSETFTEGLSAFIEKRDPDWKD